MGWMKEMEREKEKVNGAEAESEEDRLASMVATAHSPKERKQ